MKNNQKGFGLVLGLLLVAVLATIGLAGWYVLKTQDGSNKNPTAKKVSKEFIDCGSKTITDLSIDTSKPVERTNDCFEQAFQDCKKANFVVKAADFGVDTEYSIRGKDIESGKCRGGYKYIKHPSESLVGKYSYCDLNLSTTPFLSAYAEAGSGMDNEIADRCDSTIVSFDNL